jgi:hypothetical protein
MRRKLFSLVGFAMLSALVARAEIRHLELSIFGMD